MTSGKTPSSKLDKHIQSLLESLSEDPELSAVSSLEHVLVSSPYPMYLADVKGNYLLVNRPWCELTGMDPEAARGEGWRQALHLDDRNRVRKEWRQTLRDHIPWRCEYRLAGPQGEVVWVQDIAFFLRDTDGVAQGLLGIAVDQTESKRKLLDLESIFETSHDLLCAADDKGVFQRVNPAAEQMLGYKASQLVGKPFWDFVHPDDIEPTTAELERRAVSGDGTVSFLNRYLRKDGSQCWLEWSGSPNTPDGLIYTTARDVTARIEIEKRLRASEEKLRRLIESSEDIIFSVTPEGIYTTAGGRRLAIYGMAPEDIVGHSIWELDPENADWYQERHLRVLNTGEPLTYEHEYTYRGVTQIGQTTVYPILDETGKPVEVGIICRNVSEQRQIEQRLRESEAEKSLILETTAELIVYYDHDMRVRWLNKVAAESTGKTPEQARGRLCWEIFHDRQEPCPDCPIVKTRDTGEPQMAETVGPDGRIWLLHSYAARDQKDEVVGVVEYGLDITERRRVQRELQAREERYRYLYEHSPLALQSLDAEGNIVEVNRTWLDLLGYSSSEVVGKPFTRFLAPGGEERFNQAYTSFKQNNGARDVVHKMLRGDDSVLWASLSGRAEYDEDGSYLHFNCVLKDVTAKVETEEALRESEERFRDIVENSPMGFYQTTPDGRIIFANQAILRMLGYESLKELARRNLNEDGFMPDYPRSQFIATIEREGKVRGFQAVWNRTDGSRVFVRESARVVRNERGESMFYEGTVEDVSERVKAERNLERTTEHLRLQSRELLEKNVALRQVLSHLEDERLSFRQEIAMELSESLTPYLSKLKAGRSLCAAEVDAMFGTVDALLAGEFRDFNVKYETLSPRESEICGFVREGFTSKEIADTLNLSSATIHKHRELIRRKLGIQNSKINLATFLRLHKHS